MFILTQARDAIIPATGPIRIGEETHRVYTVINRITYVLGEYASDEKALCVLHDIISWMRFTEANRQYNQTISSEHDQRLRAVNPIFEMPKE